MGSISAVLLYSYIGYLSMILPITIILIAALFYHQMGKLYTQILRLVRLKLLQNQRKTPLKVSSFQTIHLKHAKIVWHVLRI